MYSRVFLCRAIVRAFCVCVVVLRVCLRGRRRFSRRSTALFACVFACVCMRMRACACACVPRVKCAHVYVFQYMRVEFCL